MQKPTEQAIAAFTAVFPGDERAERKQMFGMPAGFVNGNMFIGVFADGVVLRLPEARRSALTAADGVTHFEPMEGRPWKEYLHADAGRWGTSSELKAWAREALEHTATLPPKAKKPRKKKKAT